MRAFVMALILTASPAWAGMWVNEDCSFNVETIDGKFVIFTQRDDPRDGTTCDIEDWPLSSPVAKLVCDDGSAPEMRMETKDGPIVFEGRTLAVWRDGACKD